VWSDDLPPLERPVTTAAFGLVAINEVTGEIVDPNEIAEHYPGVGAILSGLGGGLLP